MSGDWQKLTMGLRDEQNIERLRAKALMLAEWVVTERSAGPDNYRVEVFTRPPREDDWRWVEIRTGTRGYCIGYADANSSNNPAQYRVTGPSGYVLWPEDAEGFPEEVSRG